MVYCNYTINFLGTAMHDILDVMWIHPEIFYWPTYGWWFPLKLQTAWQGFITFGGLRIRQVDALDTIGALMLLYFFMRLALNDKIIDCLKSGRFRY